MGGYKKTKCAKFGGIDCRYRKPPKEKGKDKESKNPSDAPTPKQYIGIAQRGRTTTEPRIIHGSAACVGGTRSKKFMSSKDQSKTKKIISKKKR